MKNEQWPSDSLVAIFKKASELRAMIIRHNLQCERDGNRVLQVSLRRDEGFIQLSDPVIGMCKPSKREFSYYMYDERVIDLGGVKVFALTERDEPRSMTAELEELLRRDCK